MLILTFIGLGHILNLNLNMVVVMMRFLVRVTSLMRHERLAVMKKMNDESSGSENSVDVEETEFGKCITVMASCQTVMVDRYMWVTV